MASCLGRLQTNNTKSWDFDNYESMLDWSNDIKHIASSRIAEARTSFRSFAKVMDRLSKGQRYEVPEVEKETTPTKKAPGKKKAVQAEYEGLEYDPPVCFLVLPLHPKANELL